MSWNSAILGQNVLVSTRNCIDFLHEKSLIEKCPNCRIHTDAMKRSLTTGIKTHPNVVLFMTHGGLFSQHEAINAGVPVVCTPYFGDQPMNAEYYEEKGIGVKLLYNTLSEETIYSAITTVLSNPEYRKNVRQLSRIYRDQPVSPADSLVYWVEYVLRHKGAQHLRPASAHMPWYQLALLDVLAVILLAVSASLLVLYLVIKNTISFIRGVCTASVMYRGTRNKKQD